MSRDQKRSRYDLDLPCATIVIGETFGVRIVDARGDASSLSSWPETSQNCGRLDRLPPFCERKGRALQESVRMPALDRLLSKVPLSPLLEPNAQTLIQNLALYGGQLLLAFAQLLVQNSRLNGLYAVLLLGDGSACLECL